MLESKVEDRSPQPPTYLAAGACRPGAGMRAGLQADEAGSQPTGAGGVNN